MTSATITEVCGALERLLARTGHERADVRFWMHRGEERIRISMRTSDGTRQAVIEIGPETDAERKEGPLAYPRRVTLQLQALEDAVK